MRSRTGTVLESPDELGGDQLAPARHRGASGPGAGGGGGGPAEVAGTARAQAAEIALAAREGPPEVEPGRRQTPHDPCPHESPVHREHECRLELAGMPFSLRPRASQQRADPWVGHGRHELSAWLES